MRQRDEPSGGRSTKNPKNGNETSTTANKSNNSTRAEQPQQQSGATFPAFPSSSFLRTGAPPMYEAGATTTQTTSTLVQQQLSASRERAAQSRTSLLREGASRPTALPSGGAFPPTLELLPPKVPSSPRQLAPLFESPQVASSPQLGAGAQHQPSAIPPSPYLLPHSPAPSPQWAGNGQRTMPKSALLMQTFLKSAVPVSAKSGETTPKMEEAGAAVSNSSSQHSVCAPPKRSAGEEAEESARNGSAAEERSPPFNIFNFDFDEFFEIAPTTAAEEVEEEDAPKWVEVGERKGEEVGREEPEAETKLGENNDDSTREKQTNGEEEEGQAQQSVGAPPTAATSSTETECDLLFRAGPLHTGDAGICWPLSSFEECILRVEQQLGREAEATEKGGERKYDAKEALRIAEKGESEEQVGEVQVQGEVVASDVKAAKKPAPSSRKGSNARRTRQIPPPLAPLEGAPSADGCSQEPSCSAAVSSPLHAHSVERIRIGGFALRNVPSRRDRESQLSVGIRLDGREVFRSGAVRLNDGNNCVISEEFAAELPRSFHALQLTLFELSDGARVQRQIGRLRLTKRELAEQYGATGNNAATEDRWLPITRLRFVDHNDVLGAMCAELSWDQRGRALNLSVFDFTVWTLPEGRDNPLERHSREGGRLYLKSRLLRGRTAFGTMHKMRLVERRGAEPIRFECVPLFGGGAAAAEKPAAPLPPTSPREEWLSGLSACSSPCTPCWPTSGKGGRRNSRQFHFPPPSSPTGTAQQTPRTPRTPKGPTAFPMEDPRVHIKLYGQSNYEDCSYFGYVRIPLDPDTMQPRESAPRGPNWFNIRSRTATTTSPLTQTVHNNSNNSSSKRLTAALSSPIPTLKQQPAQRDSHKSGDQVSGGSPPPALPRHCSTPSTSSSSISTAKASAAPRPVVNTRAQPSKTSSFTSLLSGSAGNNGLVLQNKRNTQHDQQHKQRRSLASSEFANIAHRGDDMGEVHLKLWYSMDEILPFVHYQPLYMNLIRSLSITPYSHSLISLIQCLQVDIESLAKSLMKIFYHSNKIRAFFRLICTQYVSSCNDVNTLFRSQSLASKVMYEMMKFAGHNYLVVSLKPLIDLIFAERRCCEIDPSKLKPGDSLEQNIRNITVYAELAFSRVVDSLHRCPQILRELFAVLREVVEQFFPGRDDVARLALSSFLIMRFFAAAILNPKLFSLRLDTPNVDVSRTLVLVSKILQRLANCVVSAHPLTTKEQWLTPVLQRFSDEAHKDAMISFLDGISAVSTAGEEMSTSAQLRNPVSKVNNENEMPGVDPLNDTAVLKFGYLIERRSGPVKKRSFKNLIHPKRRLVVLTASTLNWQKGGGSSKDAVMAVASAATSSSECGGSGEHKSQIALTDVTSVSVLPETKNTFRVATTSTEVHLQTNSEAEMNEWIILIQKQQRRHLMRLNSRSSADYSSVQTAEVDVEKELQIVYSQLAEHLDTLCSWGWCCRQGCTACGGGDAKQQQQHLTPPRRECGEGKRYSDSDGGRSDMSVDYPQHSRIG